jgi:hypothetical protein
MREGFPFKGPMSSLIALKTEKILKSYKLESQASEILARHRVTLEDAVSRSLYNRSRRARRELVQLLSQHTDLSYGEIAVLLKRHRVTIRDMAVRT